MRTPTKHVIERENVRLKLSSSWTVLGPFQIGTREASWGADPLEAIGGFRSLQYDSKATFNSSLGAEGQVKWSQVDVEVVATSPTVSEVVATVAFPDVDWSWLQKVYGWAVLQYQAWCRCELIIESYEVETAVLYTDNVLEFWIDDDLYFGGDYYGFRRAPVVLRLKPGPHRLDIRLLRDLRAMGGTGVPNIAIGVKAAIFSGGLSLAETSMTVADVVDGKLASPYASVIVRNDEEVWVHVKSIDSTRETASASLLRQSPLTIAPGQSRPVAFTLNLTHPPDLCLSLRINYVREDESAVLHSLRFRHTLSTYDLFSPQKITFLHPGNVVSYAVLRPPSKQALSTVQASGKLPVFLNLHGSGLDPDSEQARHTLDGAPDLRAWVVYPTGMSLWSSDDWHDWASLDVDAAVGAVQDWISRVEWVHATVDTRKWFVSGHSNGGQGALYQLTHQPDRIIGAAPVAGYSSIQSYVPYSLWTVSEPKIFSIIQGGLRSYRHELLVSNFIGIPVLQQHSIDDDNVPAFHSRRMHQLAQAHQDSKSSYVEVPSEDHWYKGIMTSEHLKAFYQSCLDGGANLPALPRSFRLTVANSAGMGSRGGLSVDQLEAPDQLGFIDATLIESGKLLRLQTSNIRRFHFSDKSSLLTNISKIWVDNQEFDVKDLRAHSIDLLWLINDAQHWKICADQNWTKHERHASQLGSLSSILRTQGEFAIQTSGQGAFEVGLSISRNLCQYFGADSEIVDSSQSMVHVPGNLVSVFQGKKNIPYFAPGFPIQLDEKSGIRVYKEGGQQYRYNFEEGLGLICLKPFQNSKLELVLWGFDMTGLQLAARLFPMLTGVGQPDFVIVTRRMAWEGAAGLRALGYMDSNWRVSAASYLQ